MGLLEQIGSASKDISTDSYSMSVGELLTMYKDGELELHPEFQRFFRWTVEQKSRLIESLLLGIPIPSIFVSQTDRGTWEVIDGLQRLSTIFELTGDLNFREGGPRPPLVLEGTKYLPALESLQWTAVVPEKELPMEAKLRIKRARIDVNIVLSKSDITAKYELFQRLNTGGTVATEQEIRNAILLMTNSEFFRWLSQLANYENFKTCTPLSEKYRDEQFEMELVTRFVVLSHLSDEELRSINDLGVFLTDNIVQMASDDTLNRELTERAFKRTFDILARSLGERSFKKYDATKQTATGPVLISLFEVIAMGIGYYAKNPQYDISNEDLKLKYQQIPTNDRFMSTAGSGVSASRRIPNTISLGREIFAL